MVCLPVWDGCCRWMGPMSSVSILSAPIMERASSIFQPRQHVLAEVKKTDLRPSGGVGSSSLVGRSQARLMEAVIRFQMHQPGRNTSDSTQSPLRFHPPCTAHA